MLNLVATTDKLQLITSTAATLDCHASWADLLSGAVTPGKTNTAISTATTTDVVASPAASTFRNIKTLHIRNKHASLSTDVTVQFNQNATLFELYKVTLRPQDELQYVEGQGFNYEPSTIFPMKNGSTTSQTLSTTDAYLAGSSILIPTALPVVGTMYRCVFDIVKSAGTGAPVVSVRFGTAGAVGDVSRCAFTLSIGTSVADTAVFTIFAHFRTVGTGTTAVIQGNINVANNLATTGFSGTSPILALQNTGGGFDSTVANSFIGVSFNGGTAFAGTAQLVRAELLA